MAHAKDGFANTQEVIKFIDTKTAVVTGLSTLIGGTLVGILKWSLEPDPDSRATLAELTVSHSSTAGWFYFAVIASLAAAFVCIGSAVWSVIARARPRHLENTYTILFPIYRQRHAARACRVIEDKLKGMSKQEILSEYEDQLRILGMIVGKKLKHVRIACLALLIQLLLFAIAVALLTLMYVTDPSAPRHDRIVAASAADPFADRLAGSDL